MVTTTRTVLAGSEDENPPARCGVEPVPQVPYVRPPDLCFAYARSSRTSLKGAAAGAISAGP